MKLSITQMILGILIIFAAVYVTGWMIHEAPKQYTQPVIDAAGKTTYVAVVPEDEALFTVSRYSSYALPILGVIILIIGVAGTIKKEANKYSLVITNIVAGVLIAALSYIISRWGFPTDFHSLTPAIGGTLLSINTNPGNSLFNVHLASWVMSLAGLAILGCGIAQLTKVKKFRNA
jgi:hypothetical protein